MKAIVLTDYGPPDVLQVKEIEKPIPKEDEVLVKVHATSVNYGDLVARDFKSVSPREFNMPFLFWLIAKVSFGLRKPRVAILGSEFSGAVESIGKDVEMFKPGDPVFGYLGQNMGAYAEYVCVSEKGVLTGKPANVRYAEAAVLPYGAIMAFHLLQKMNVHSGQKILINGASGSIGSAAVQIGKYLGAEVTGVCSTPRVDFVRSLGADRVIDYRKEDFTQGGETYDLIFDVLGKSSFARAKKVLKQEGRLLYASFKLKKLLQMLRTSIAGGKRVVCAIAPGSVEDLIAVKGLIEEGKLKAIIDRSFPMEQAAEAHRYVEAGDKKGYVVITMAEKE